MSPKRSWGIVLMGALALVPCVAVVALIYRYGGQLPIDDQWDTPGRLFDAQLLGTLQWKELFAQHNEARKAFSSIVWMLLATGGWNTRLEMYASVLLVALSVSFYRSICRRSSGRSQLVPLLLAAIASAILFNPVGFTGFPSPWLWGGNLENAIVLAALLGGIWANLHVRSTPVRYAVSTACSVAATYSFASGMLLWVLLYPQWFCLGGREHTVGPRWREALHVAYVALFSTVVSTYFCCYAKPAEHPSLSAGLGHPGQLVQFYCTWLGAPLSMRPLDLRFTMVVGCAAVAILVQCLAIIARYRIWVRALPFLLLVVYVLIAGVATSLGRSSLGVEGALAPRYFLHVLPFYLGLNGLLWLSSTLSPARQRRGVAKVFFAFLLGLQLTSVAFNWARIYPDHLRILHERYTRGEAALQFVDSIPDNPDLDILKKHQLVRRFKRLVREGVLDVELGPGDGQMLTADFTADQSSTLFVTVGSEELWVSGSWRDGPSTTRVTHLMLRARAGDREKLISVLPLDAFPRARGENLRSIDARVEIGNALDGTQTLELFGFELSTSRLVPLSVESELRRGRISAHEILDSTTLGLTSEPSLVTVDFVNGAVAELGSEITLPRGEPLEFVGWAYDARKRELAARVYVKVGTRLFPAQYHQRRPDVVQILGRPDLFPCGFICRMDDALLGADASGHFTFVIETRQGELFEDPRTLTIRRADR